MRTQRCVLSKRGYTLLELCVTLVIICITAAIIYPMVATPDSRKSKRNHCMSNLKQIGIAALMYSQDNDNTLPPAQIHSPDALQDNVHKTRFWLGEWEIYPNQAPALQTKTGFLAEYSSELPYHCPTVPNGRSKPADWSAERYGYQTVYLTNDFAGGIPFNAIAKHAVTILACDGDTGLFSTGHTLSDAAATRHSGGACYLFADGHMRWNTPETVFFPEAGSTNRTHLNAKTGKHIGPDPKSDMYFNGKKYMGTFHIR